MVQGSVHPLRTGIEAGLSAVGDIFNAIAARAGTDVATLSHGLEKYRAGQTGLLRMTWDNGDRTVLVNPNLRGITLGWNLQSTAQDELFAAIEGTALHTRVIFDRMSSNGVPLRAMPVDPPSVSRLTCSPPGITVTALNVYGGVPPRAASAAPG